MHLQIAKSAHLQDECVPRLLEDNGLPLGFVGCQPLAADLEGGASAFWDGGVRPKFEREDNSVAEKPWLDNKIFQGKLYYNDF